MAQLTREAAASELRVSTAAVTQELQARMGSPSGLLQHRATCVIFKAVQDANAAAISAKTAAVSNGKPWSVHAVDEQAKRLAAGAAENEACQLQLGNKGFLIVCCLQVHVGLRVRPQ